MTLIDKGLKNGLVYGHTDYITHKGRFITHSKNQRERYVNPKLTVKQRSRISTNDTNRRNRHKFSLHCENNANIVGSVQYNYITEALYFNYSIHGTNGKKVLNITKVLGERTEK
ncbi:unnamed protein product [marine sediment metagenome]|uniref:Uncharacterized protein n=1 Tax=marine sediment metagenome TaxID=412755 RepID=X1GS06_9ZZZZ